MGNRREGSETKEEGRGRADREENLRGIYVKDRRRQVERAS